MAFWSVVYIVGYCLMPGCTLGGYPLDMHGQCGQISPIIHTKGLLQIMLLQCTCETEGNILIYFLFYGVRLYIIYDSGDYSIVMLLKCHFLISFSHPKDPAQLFSQSASYCERWSST